MKIFLKLFVVLFLKVSDVYMVHSQKPVAERVWREYCQRNGLALNDCNWCRCDSRLQYTCTARICSNVDMFGHFNDAIKEVDVGMEGHGVWRTLKTACEPGVHYKKKDLLCVCTEDGKWPNPVCRDIFQVLHAVIPTDFKEPNNQTCTPNNLYQVGCNVCLCCSKGIICSKYCTKRNCTNDDVAEPNKPSKNDTSEFVDEMYAACERAKKYQIGCQHCICLPNNRLLCDNCTSVTNFTIKVQGKPSTNLCTGRTPYKRFKKGCNICSCDNKDIIYCTVYNCLDNNTNVSLPETAYETVDSPVDDNDCVPGTKYNRDCNLCHCFMLDGIKHFGCTKRKCINGKAYNDTCGCAEGTKYEKNCLICNCLKLNGEKNEICSFNEKCRSNIDLERVNDTETSLEDTRSLSSMHGYCEPLHTYLHECNKCKCLTDGKTVACTSKQCANSGEVKSLVVEFVPFIQKQNVCPKGHKYKVDCNLCHCMSNGNALCTTNACSGIKTIRGYICVLFHILTKPIKTS